MFINCTNIQFSYFEGKNVLNDISFNLFQGETLAIVGASGCGKSTLLRILAGILPKEKGNNFLGSVTIDGLSPDQYRQTGKLAFMFQEATLLPHLTVRQNIELPLRIKGKADSQISNDLIKAVGLEEFSNYLPKQISGGMKTRVALARSFSTNPELLLLDEPFSALDIAWKSKLYVELEKLKELHNTTVVIVTHDVQEALLLADKIIVFGKNGHIIHEEKVLSSETVLDRVTNIAKYNGTDVFRRLFSSVQKWILNDAVRNIASEQEVEKIIQKIKSAAGNEKLEMQCNDEMVSLNTHSGTQKNHNLLFDAFQKGTPYLKNELLWDLLEYEGIENQRMKIILDYYLNHIETVSTQARDSFYKLESNKFLDVLIVKINNRHRQKNWIYLCDMYASSETSRVLQYLENVENGMIQQLNYPFAKEVAQKVKAKIDEK